MTQQDLDELADILACAQNFWLKGRIQDDEVFPMLVSYIAEIAEDAVPTFDINRFAARATVDIEPEPPRNTNPVN